MSALAPIYFLQKGIHDDGGGQDERTPTFEESLWDRNEVLGYREGEAPLPPPPAKRPSTQFRANTPQPSLHQGGKQPVRSPRRKR